MNEKTLRLAFPAAAFDDLLCRPFGGRMRRHVHVENLPASVMDHEEQVQRSKRYGLDAKEITILRPSPPPLPDLISAEASYATVITSGCQNEMVGLAHAWPS